MGRREQKRRTPGAVRGGIARDKRSVLFGGARRKPALAALAAVVALLVAALVVLVVRPALAQVVTPVVTIGDPTGAAARTADAVVQATATPPPASGPVDLAPLPTATPTPQPTPDGSPLSPDSGTARLPFKAIEWHSSRAVGRPNGGRLVAGTQLPSEGLDWFTWDWGLKRSPNRGFRRWGTDALIRTTVMTLAAYRYADPSAPRVGVADLSLTRGGFFGRRWGGSGHASHQNGLDVDILYPRTDGRPRPPRRPSQIDRRRAQDLVDRFVDAGAQYVFVGLNTGLTGPKGVVQAIPNHDDHIHVRIPAPR